MAVALESRVRVTANPCNSSLYSAGDTGVVSEVSADDSDSVIVTLDSGVVCWFVASESLELVS